MKLPRWFMSPFIAGAWFIDCLKLLFVVTLLILGVVLNCGRFVCTGFTGLLLSFTTPVLPLLVRIGWFWTLLEGILVFTSTRLTSTFEPPLPTFVTGRVTILPGLVPLPAFVVV